MLPLNHALMSPIPLYIAFFPRQSSANALVKLFLCPWLARPEFQFVGPPIDDSMLFLHRRAQKIGNLMEVEILHIPTTKVNTRPQKYQTRYFIDLIHTG